MIDFGSQLVVKMSLSLKKVKKFLMLVVAGWS